MPTIILLIGAEKFKIGIAGLRRTVADQRTVWDAIIEEFYKIEAQQFKTEGRRGGGRWQPLSKSYKKWKAIKFPGKPIMQQSGRLMRSLTEFDDADSVVEEEPDMLTIGTAVPYAARHHYGHQGTPARPLIVITPADEARFQEVWDERFTEIAAKLGFSVVT